MSAANLNVGHGYINPRPDGAKARCGGPYFCKVCQIERAAASAAIAPPVAAGSVDTPEFQRLAELWRYAPAGTREFMAAWDGQIAHINAWGAQQREAGRQEGMQTNENAYQAVIETVRVVAARAEKAEADLKARDFFVDVLNCQMKKAEARVKELEADAMRWRYLRDLDHDLTGTPGKPCVALPNGMSSGYYLTGPEAVFAVDASMAEAVPK